MKRYSILSALSFLMAACAAIAGYLAIAQSEPALPAARPELILQYSHMDRVYDVSFAAHAPVLATLGYPANPVNASIDIWDTRSWTLLRTIDAHEEESRNYNTKAIALSPDGRVLAQLSESEGVLLWDVATGKLSKTLKETVGLPVGIAWSPDGRLIAAGGTEAVKLWNVSSGELVRSFTASGDVAFSGNGKTLGIASEDSAALYDVTSGKKMREFKDKAGVSGPIAISPDGRYVATGGEDPKWDPGDWPYEGAPTESFYAHQLKVKIWDARTGKRLRMLPGHYNLDGGTVVLQFSPDSRRLFSGGQGYAALWDIHTAKAIRNLDNEYGSALSPDGKMIAVGRYTTTADGLSVISVATGKSVLSVANPPHWIEALAFSPDGKTLAEATAGAQDSTELVLWDARRGRISHALAGPPADLRSVGFIGNQQVFSNSLNGIYIWNPATGKLLHKMKGPMEKSSLSGPEQKWALMTPDGSKIMNESGTPFSRSYEVRDRSTGKVVAKIASGGGWLADAAFSPDGNLVAVPSRAGKPGSEVITVWNLQTGAKISDLAESGSHGMAIEFSPDSHAIAGTISSCEDLPEGNKLVIWDVATGKILRSTGLGHNRANVLELSRDGSTAAIAMDNSVRIYSMATLSEISMIKGGDTEITALAFSPDGKRLAAGDNDGRLRIWDTASKKLLITMICLPTQNKKAISQNWIAYTPDGRYDWSPGAASLIRWRRGGKLYPAEALAKEMRREIVLW